MSVLLVGHIACALLSSLGSALMALRPSRRGMYVIYGLTALTLASGTWLVITLHQPLTVSCLTGLSYLGLVMAGLIRAQHVLYSE